MRLRTAGLTLVLAVGLAACSHHRAEADKPEHKNAGDSLAHEAGKAAYHAAQGTKKVAEAAGKALTRASHDARQGWDEASHEHHQKSEK